MRLDYTSDAGHAGNAALGLIVLQTDETIEPEIGGAMRNAGATLYHTRIPFEPVVTSETLARMAKDIPAAAELLSQEIPFKVIGYGCTSAATVIGPARVAQLVREKHAGVAVTEPLSAVIASAKALGAKKIGFLTPYRAEVTAAMRARLEEAGLGISQVASFEQEEDHQVALISEASVMEGVRAVAKGADMVFSACTNLRAFGVIEAAEAALGLPVVSSNSALAWHMQHLAGISKSGPGQLFKL